MKKTIFIGGIFLIIIFSIIYFLNVKRKILVINGNEIKVEIADTFETRYKGLSNRDNLCEDCGMLFAFNEKDTRTFVMRDMKFGLDIIWIADGRIVKIDENLPAEGFAPKIMYSSTSPVDMVLEVNEGYCYKKGIKLDDFVAMK
ncbi:MAG: DUF192 domain-containing protein [bacterium]